MAKRSPTAQSSGPALPFALVLCAFVLLVSALGLSLPWTLLLLPAALLLAFLAARAQRGMPATLRGVQQSGRPVEDMTPGGRGRPRFQLVAMPVNHYGEKLRWALDLVGVPYEESTVGGLLSAGLRGRSVPWLVDRKACSVLGNSDEALAYIGEVVVPEIEEPERRARAAALLARTDRARAWEPRLNLLGHAVQGWCYHHLLKRGTDRLPTLRAWGAHEALVPWPDRLAIRVGYLPLRGMLHRAFSLGSTAKADQRLRHIRAVFDEADAALADSPFLTGPTLSYVDLSLASLAAPLMPTRLLYASPSPYAGGRFRSFDGAVEGREIPAPLAEMEEALAARPCGQHVLRLFAERRLGTL
jgi:glutathione S-transferase